jgi:periplasmic divalent cation tolerance protein
MESYILALVACPSQEEAEKISNLLLSERLVACINLVNDVNSLFHWRGKIEHKNETLLLIKSRKKHLAKLIELVQLYHSYDVPEIIALPILGGSNEYLDWIKEETT